MNSKFLLCLAVILTGGLIGCSTSRSAETAPTGYPWISFNGKQLLVRNRLWDVESGKEIRQFAVPPQITISNGVARGLGCVEAVAFSPDGKRVLTATAQYLAPEIWEPGPVQLWDIASGRKLLEFKPDELINNARFLPDGKRILTTSNGQKYPIQIWDAQTGHRLLALHEYPVSLYSAQIASYSPDGRLIATAGSAGTRGHYYGTVNIRNSITGQRICTIEDTTNSFFNSAQFSPDGKSILTVDHRGVTNSHGVTTIWDAKTGRRIRDFVQVGLPLFTPDGGNIVGVDARKRCTILLCDAKSGDEIRQLTIPGSEGWWNVERIALSHDGRRLLAQYLVSSGQIAVALWDTDTGKLIKQFGKEDAMAWQALVGFSPESEHFVLFNKNGKPELYDGATGKRLNILEEYQQP